MSYQNLAVRFQSGNPTTGAYDQLPLEVLEIDDPSQLPQDGQDWIAMTLPSLNDYIARYRAKSEPLSTIQMASPYNTKKVDDAMNFGRSIILQAAAENIDLGLNSAQIIGVLTKFAPLVGMLQSGAISTALLSLQHTTPDALVTQARINKYIALIQNYLSKPK